MPREARQLQLELRVMVLQGGQKEFQLVPSARMWFYHVLRSALAKLCFSVMKQGKQHNNSLGFPLLQVSRW